MKKNLLKGLFMLGAILCYGFAQAQTVSGTVSDETGPLPGANVIVKGTTNGTTTDFDGNYVLNNVPSGAVLEFSYVGFETQEVPVNGQSTVNVVMAESSNELDEVILIGYGQTTRRDATGAVESVKPEDFNKGVQVNVTELVQGRVAGVQVTSASGEPGAASNLRIRGTTSIRGDNNPLYVVDGIPLDGRDITANSDTDNLGATTPRNPLNFINPNDIASIDILKDASATAIYGSRGANGVIIITTKKGKSGAPKLSYNGYFGVSNIARRIDELNSAEYREAIVIEGVNESNDFGADEDAFGDVLRTGYTQSHDVSFSGGNDKSNYRFGLGYFDQTGIVENSSLERTTISLDLGQNLFYSEGLGEDRVRVDTKMIYSLLNDSYAPITNDAGFEGSLIGQALQWNPTRPLFNDDGTFTQPGNDVRNPLASLEYFNDRSNTSRLLLNIATTFKITSGLNYKFNYGLERSESVRRTTISPQLIFGSIFNDPFTGEQRAQGEVNINNLYATSSLFEHTLNYTSDFSDDRWKLDAVLGYSYQEFLRRGNRTRARNFRVTELSIDFADVIQFVNDPDDFAAFAFNDPTYELQSFFGRANVGFLDKFLLTFTIRADGSTRFGDNNKYGTFPSGAFAWRMSEEEWMPEVVSNLKFRIGYGITGNQEFGSAFSQNIFSLGAAIGENTPRQTRAGNPDLKWETTSQFNVGFDYGFWNNRLRGSIDFWTSNTTDLLFQLAPIPPSPNARFFENLDATIENTGWDIAIGGDLISKENMIWDLTFNMGFVNNKVKDYNDPDIFTGDINGQGLSAERAQIIRNGESLFSFHLPIFEGFDENGNSIFTDVDGDGQIETGVGGDDRVIAGTAIPDFTIGINTSFTWRSLDVTANFNGAYGAKVYDNTSNAVFVKGNINNSRNISRDEVGNGESVSNSNAVSTRYLQSGDYFRLNNLTVGYTFNNLTDFLSSLRVYATGQNLFVITPYDGFDPEVNTDKSVDGIPSLGIEYTPYPRARTFIFGLNVNF